MANALQTTPLRQVKDVKSLLMNEQARQQLAMVAAKHMNPERMMRVVANAIRTTPKLGQCEPISFLGALMQCASLGLEPNTILGHAYLIPFENKRKGIIEVQVVVGYKGLIDLARRSGHITSLSANIHYSDDDLWEYEEGTEARLRHRPGNMQGEKLHAYAIAKFRDGGYAYVVLPWAHVMAIRDASQGYKTAIRFNKKDTPWIAHEDEMAKKTAVRALSKYLPLSVEFVDAITVDEHNADYRSFALDPTAGVSVDEDVIGGEAEDVDPETGEVKEKKDTKAKPKAEAEKPDDVDRAVEREKTSTEDNAKREDAPTKNGDGADLEQFRGLLDMIKRDLEDAPDVDDVADLYAPQTEQMQAIAPDMHAELLAEFKAYREKEGAEE